MPNSDRTEYAGLIIGGDSWIHSTSMISVGYYVEVTPNSPSANVRNLPFNT